MPSLKQSNSLFPLRFVWTILIVNILIKYWVLGDSRVNQHPHHTVMYTLWVREHNRIAKALEVINPHWDDNRLFNEARRIVIAEIQHITYKNWLPFILGKGYSRKKGFEVKSKGFGSFYDTEVDSSVTNEFATAGFNFVYSLLQDKIRYVFFQLIRKCNFTSVNKLHPLILRKFLNMVDFDWNGLPLDLALGNCDSIEILIFRLYDENRETKDSISLQDHFNQPAVMQDSNTFEKLIRGLTVQQSQKMDSSIVDDVSYFLEKKYLPFKLFFFRWRVSYLKEVRNSGSILWAWISKEAETMDYQVTAPWENSAIYQPAPNSKHSQMPFPKR